ncbi:MAG: ABC transporter substrate-binding protein [Hyphomicrobiales bacterium]
MRRTLMKSTLFALALSLATFAIRPASAEPLTVGYSDWPGWVAWQVAIDKDWFKEAGVDVKFEWFDYVASMDAFAAGKTDAVLMTNGDTLVTGSGGGKGIIVMATDYSNGNDQIVAKPGIKSVEELKGKKIGVEVGFVDHLLILQALEKSDMSEEDVELVNTKTNDTPQVLASGQVEAIAAWPPSSYLAQKAVPGSRPIFTSAEAPGLIYDVLAISPQSLNARKEDWVKFISVWDRVVKYINDPATQEDALAIMSKRNGLSPEEYKPLLNGTRLLSLDENKKVFEKGPGLDSMYGSTKISDDFNVKYEVYKEPQDVDSYIDPALIDSALKPMTTATP